jgi:REP element-mobilizing transposase RayT
MARAVRAEVIDETQVGVYHCINRCVRRAFLCGQDPVSGRNFDHRKGQIQRRLEFLAGQFGIDVLGFTIMSNHLHVVLRNRPDVVAGWSDDEVARRWWMLFPQRRDNEGQPAGPEPHELAMLTADAKALEERRRRLSSVSWLMRCLCEGIARQANREDQCTGRFWEGRFKCQALLDEAAILACSVYVDLNPIRAGVAATPETSRFTSAFERIHANRQQLNVDATAAHRKAAAATPRKPAGRAIVKAAGASDAWLSPIELASGLTSSVDAEPPGRRASNLGFLPLSLAEYLRLLDWTGRQIRRDKRGAIPADLAPILKRLHVAGDAWLDQVQHFGRWFRRAVGRASTLAAAAAQRGRRWLHGIARSRQAFE